MINTNFETSFFPPQIHAINNANQVVEAHSIDFPQETKIPEQIQVGSGICFSVNQIWKDILNQGVKLLEMLT
jgi:hypothetical protein